MKIPEVVTLLTTLLKLGEAAIRMPAVPKIGELVGVSARIEAIEIWLTKRVSADFMVGVRNHAQKTAQGAIAGMSDSEVLSFMVNWMPVSVEPMTGASEGRGAG